MTEQPDPRIAVLAALSSPGWHPVPEAHGMPWDEAVALLAAYDASRAAAPSAPADRAAIRDRIADAVARVDSGSWGTETEAMHPYWQKVYRAYADAVLAVLPELADREAALREAEGALRAQAKRMAGEFNDSDVLHEDGPAATVATWKRAADLLRRMAGEAQQPETQDATHEWFVETRMLDGRWSKYGAARDTAEDGRELFERDTASLTKPHTFRLVHATTTFAVEAEHEPAAVSQPGKEATQ